MLPTLLLLQRKEKKSMNSKCATPTNHSAVVVSLYSNTQLYLFDIYKKPSDLKTFRVKELLFHCFLFVFFFSFSSTVEPFAISNFALLHLFQWQFKRKWFLQSKCIESNLQALSISIPSCISDGQFLVDRMRNAQSSWQKLSAASLRPLTSTERRAFILCILPSGANGATSVA